MGDSLDTILTRALQRTADEVILEVPQISAPTYRHPGAFSRLILDFVASPIGRGSREVGLVDINVHPLDYYIGIGLPMSESLNDSRAACVWFENGSGDILAWAGPRLVPAESNTSAYEAALLEFAEEVVAFLEGNKVLIVETVRLGREEATRD